MPIVLRKKYLSIFWKMAKSLWEDQEINFYWEIIGSATEGSPIKQETISVGEMFWNSRMMYFGPLQLLILLFYSWQIQESRIKMYKFKANQSYPDLTNLRLTYKVGSLIYFTYTFRGGPVKKTSQKLRMLSMSLSDCKSLTPNVII